VNLLRNFIKKESKTYTILKAANKVTDNFKDFDEKKFLEGNSAHITWKI
jgi:hypothetical protein